jgi:hypothetical protein
MLGLGGSGILLLELDLLDHVGNTVVSRARCASGARELSYLACRIMKVVQVDLAPRWISEGSIDHSINRVYLQT